MTAKQKTKNEMTKEEKIVSSTISTMIQPLLHVASLKDIKGDNKDLSRAIAAVLDVASDKKVRKALTDGRAAVSRSFEIVSSVTMERTDEQVKKMVMETQKLPGGTPNERRIVP